MKETIKRHWSGLRTSWQNGLGWEVRRTAIAFFALALLGFAACMVLPDLRDRLVEYVLSLMDGMDVMGEDGSLSALGLFFNNVRACVFGMIYGFLPFVYLPALALGMNAVLIGIMAAWYVAQDISLLVYFAALLPHGIFELPAVTVSFAVGLYICGGLTRRIRRRDNSAPRPLECLLVMIRALFFVELPLLAVAAVIEAYITPLVVTLLFMQ